MELVQIVFREIKKLQKLSKHTNSVFIFCTLTEQTYIVIGRRFWGRKRFWGNWKKSKKFGIFRIGFGWVPGLTITYRNTILVRKLMHGLFWDRRNRLFEETLKKGPKVTLFRMFSEIFGYLSEVSGTSRLSGKFFSQKEPSAPSLDAFWLH